MAERGLPAPKKAVRAKMDQAKTTDQAKAREPSQRNHPKQNPQNRTPQRKILH